MATLISVDQESPFISHLPLVFEKTDDGHRLIRHLAKGNPHWKLLENREVYVIFHGPNAYITPQWYEKNDVPTWSYAVVHVKGFAKLITNYQEIISCLKKLSDVSESRSKNPWEFWIPDDLSTPSAIERSIVGFEIKVSDIKSKYKLNQTVSEKSIQGCIEGLLSEPRDTNRELAEMMLNSWKKFNKS